MEEENATSKTGIEHPAGLEVCTLKCKEGEKDNQVGVKATTAKATARRQEAGPRRRGEKSHGGPRGSDAPRQKADRRGQAP